MEIKSSRNSSNLFYTVLFFWNFFNPASFPEARANEILAAVATNFHNPFKEIAEKFDLTRERVRQIKEKAIRRLKQTSRSKILKTYLG